MRSRISRVPLISCVLAAGVACTRPTPWPSLADTIPAIGADSLDAYVWERIDGWMDTTGVSRRDAATALPEGARAFYLTWTLQGQVGNGGLFQYFWNGGDETADETIAALEAMEANETARITREAWNRYRAEPRIGEYRLRWLAEESDDELMRIYRTASGLIDTHGLNNAFYASEANLAERRRAYVRAYADRF